MDPGTQRSHWHDARAEIVRRLRARTTRDATGARIVAALALAIGLTSSALAGDCLRDSNGKVVCGKGDCMMDEYGKVYCAREGGGAMREQYGRVVCGLGYCAADDMGRVKCSTRPGGSALMDINGKVVCSGSCQDASAQLCEGPLRPLESRGSR